MKIALYIENGLEQIVLTPETATEKGIVGKLQDKTRDLTIYTGGFYACRGGWTRHSQSSDDSTIIVLSPHLGGQAMKMIEKVARAIAECSEPGLWDDPDFDKTNPPWRKAAYIDEARAAVEALLEPTEGMKKASYNELYERGPNVDYNDGVPAYRAMLQQVLDE